MATDTGYAKRDFLRVCDICGHRFHFSQLKPIGELKFACPDDAPGLTALQISRFNARARPLIVKPNKHAKGLTQTPIYQLAEAQIFNFIASVAPAGERDGATDALSAAWAAIYMADVLLQEKRPALWDHTARTVIARCLSYLATLQITQEDTSKAWLGGLTTNGTTTDTTLTVAAGVAFAKAYAALGEPSYLGVANDIGHYIRSAQCGDLKTFATILYPGSSAPYRPGGLTESVTMDDDAGFSNSYNLRSVYALTFLAVMRDIRGEDAEFGLDLGGFSSPPTATIATMIDELTAFATTGPATSGASAQSGLSTTDPHIVYTADQGAGFAVWVTDDDGYQMADFALALAGLSAAETGETTITAFMAYLQTILGNFETPADSTDEETLAGLTGTFDPALCPATVIDPPYIGTSLYDWASLGLLSPILAATPSTFRTSKDTLSMPVRYTTRDITKKYLGPDGVSGLSLQPVTTTSPGLYATSVIRAARTGLLYRQDPGHYPQLRGN